MSRERSHKCGTDIQHTDRVVGTGRCRVCELLYNAAANAVNVRLARDIAHLEDTARMAAAAGRNKQRLLILNGTVNLREALEMVRE